MSLFSGVATFEKLVEMNPDWDLMVPLQVFHPDFGIHESPLLVECLILGSGSTKFWLDELKPAYYDALVNHFNSIVDQKTKISGLHCFMARCEHDSHWPMLVLKLNAYYGLSTTQVDAFGLPPALYFRKYRSSPQLTLFLVTASVDILAQAAGLEIVDGFEPLPRVTRMELIRKLFESDSNERWVDELFRACRSKPNGVAAFLDLIILQLDYKHLVQFIFRDDQVSVRKLLRRKQKVEGKK